MDIVTQSDPGLADTFQQVAGGDRQAWSLVIASINRDVERVVAKLCRDPQLREDVLQETYLAIQGAASRFEPRSSDPDHDVRRLATAIAANQAISAGRRRQRHEHKVRTVALDALPSKDRTDAIEANELHDAVHAALAELSAPFAEAVSLHHLGGLTIAEIAGIQGVKSTTVRTRVWRGLRQMRQILKLRGFTAKTALLLSLFADLRAETALTAPVYPVVTMIAAKGIIMTACYSLVATSLLATLAWSVVFPTVVHGADEEPAAAPVAAEAQPLLPTAEDILGDPPDQAGLRLDSPKVPRAVRTRLKRKITLVWKDATLAAVIRDLSRMTELEIRIARAVDGRPFRVASDPAINFSCDGMTAHSALKWINAISVSEELEYIDGVIWILDAKDPAMHEGKTGGGF